MIITTQIHSTEDSLHRHLRLGMWELHIHQEQNIMRRITNVTKEFSEINIWKFGFNIFFPYICFTKQSKIQH